MKSSFKQLFILIAFFGHQAYAQTPSEVLQTTVDQLIGVVSDKQKSDNAQRAEIESIINANVNFDFVARKVVSKPWKKATDTQKKEFIEKFSTILIDTYFKLLKNYTNEKVNYGKEQIKKDKYAIVDTKVISEGKKIPVRYRLIKTDGHWKIYDFIVEGSSLINSYKNNYKIIIKKKGMDGLLAEMIKPKKAVTETE